MGLAECGAPRAGDSAPGAACNQAWLRELQPKAASLQKLTLLAEVLSSTRFDSSAGMMPMDETSLDRAWKEICALRAKH